MTRRLLRLGVSIGYFLLSAPLRAVLNLLGIASRQFIVLTYHQVTGRQEAAFVRQLEMLRRWGRLVFADDDLAGRPERRFVALTFDDFLLEALQVAGTALSRAGIPSLWFVVSGAVGGRVNWIKNSQFQNDAAPVASFRDVETLNRELFRFGSHTRTHAPLSTLNDVELDRELWDSKAELECLTGRVVTTLSFPYGAYDLSVLRRCREAGYTATFANVPVWRIFSRAGLLRGRITVEPNDWPIEFWLKLRGGYNWLAVPGFLRQQVLPGLRGRPASRSVSPRGQRSSKSFPV